MSKVSKQFHQSHTHTLNTHTFNTRKQSPIPLCIGGGCHSAVWIVCVDCVCIFLFASHIALEIVSASLYLFERTLKLCLLFLLFLLLFYSCCCSCFYRVPERGLYYHYSYQMTHEKA